MTNVEELHFSVTGKYTFSGGAGLAPESPVPQPPIGLDPPEEDDVFYDPYDG